MAEIGRLWAGQIYGTNTGRLFLELDGAVADGGRQPGTLHVSDDVFGLSCYIIGAAVVGNSVVIDGEPKQEIEGFAQGTIRARAAIQADGHLSGEWSSSIGSAGVFKLFPHDGAVAPSGDHHPEQIYTNNKDLGALRLYRSDIVEIISSMRRKFPKSNIVVSHIDRGAELALYVNDFERKIETIDRLQWVKLNVHSPAGGGFTKSLTIDLGQSFNRITTQGPDESWVLGEAEATASSLRLRQSWLSTAIGKYRVNINQIIFLGALISMPELDLLSRATFIGGVLVVIFIADKVTQKLVPNFILNLSEERPKIATRVWPSVLSWSISATAGIAAKIIYDLLK